MQIFKKSLLQTCILKLNWLGNLGSIQSICLCVLLYPCKIETQKEEWTEFPTQTSLGRCTDCRASLAEERACAHWARGEQVIPSLGTVPFGCREVPGWESRAVPETALASSCLSWHISLHSLQRCGHWPGAHRHSLLLLPVPLLAFHRCLSSDCHRKAVRELSLH